MNIFLISIVSYYGSCHRFIAIASFWEKPEPVAKAPESSRESGGVLGFTVSMHGGWGSALPSVFDLSD